jgi:Ca2+/Na+ antiporter
MAVVRLLVFGFIALSVVYILVSIYSRSVRRERLEKEWDTDPANEGAATADRDAYIEQGMEAYQHGLRRRLLWLIYILPMVALVVVIYVVNW